MGTTRRAGDDIDVRRGDGGVRRARRPLVAAGDRGPARRPASLHRAARAPARDRAEHPLARLRTLEQEGLVVASRYSARPPRFDYRLTRTGRHSPTRFDCSAPGPRRAPARPTPPSTSPAGPRSRSAGGARPARCWPTPRRRPRSSPEPSSQRARRPPISLERLGSAEELEAGSRALAGGWRWGTSEEIRWIRSYVLAEDDGRLGTVCVYQASSPEAIRDHASRAQLAVEEIIPVGMPSWSGPTPRAQASSGSAWGGPSGWPRTSRTPSGDDQDSRASEDRSGSRRSIIRGSPCDSVHARAPWGGRSPR